MSVCLCPWLALSLGRDSYTGSRECGQYLDKRECLQNVPGLRFLPFPLLLPQATQTHL